MTTKTSLRERRQLRTRQDLVDAVLQVIAVTGLEGLTIDRVSQESGISRGTVYAYFPAGRDELVAAAYEALGHSMVARTREVMAASETWDAKIVAHAQAMIELAQHPRTGHFYNVTGPALIADGKGRGIGSSGASQMIGELLADEQSAGSLNADIDVEAMTVQLVGAVRESAKAVASGRLPADRALASYRRLVAGLST